MYWFTFSVVTLIVIGLIVGVTFLFRYKWKSDGKFKQLAQNLSISLFSILIALILLELFF
ncbi:MAG: hypothetical protein Fur0044_43380 [Anaerolineae bacterium]|nr:hypothetical protein [Anaerolineae bacterium]